MICFHQVSFSRQRAPASIEHSYPKGRGRKKNKRLGCHSVIIRSSSYLWIPACYYFPLLNIHLPLLAVWLTDFKFQHQTQKQYLTQTVKPTPPSVYGQNKFLNKHVLAHIHRTSGSASDLILTSRQMNKAEVDSLKRQIEFKIPSKSDQEKKKI